MPPRAFTTGSRSYEPDQLFEDESLIESVHAFLNKNDLRSAIIAAFGLPQSDDYVYHAVASVTLAQVQVAISAGSNHGLHDWYVDEDNKPVGHPPMSDVAAYISIFDPSKSPANVLKGFAANAKKDSLRASIAKHLISRRYVDASITVAKRKGTHPNPYIDFWAYSCHTLEFAGPDANTMKVKISHHILPVFMHHFGCVCPSYEALEIVAQLSKGKTLLDVGSGNGYWTLMLRRHGCRTIAVDSQQSRWRTCWIDDTVIGDGIQFLKKRPNTGDDVLLMVYPIVNGDFTKRALDAYRGCLICVAGTQNMNGYTGFEDTTIDKWMDVNKPEFSKIVQIPLPSFAGKDDALFIFRKP